MVRDFRLRWKLELLIFLLAPVAAVAGPPKHAQAEGLRSAYTQAELAGRRQSSPGARDDHRYANRSQHPRYDRRRAMNSLREISDHVARMKQRTQETQSEKEFDSKRAEETLQQVKSFVTEMKQRTKATQRTVSGPIKGIHVHHYNRRRVPIPDRIEKTTGLTHREFAELKLRERGYVKTINGWVPPKQKRTIVQQKPERKVRESIAGSSGNDPF